MNNISQTGMGDTFIYEHASDVTVDTLYYTE